MNIFLRWIEMKRKKKRFAVNRSQSIAIWKQFTHILWVFWPFESNTRAGLDNKTDYMWRNKQLSTFLYLYENENVCLDKDSKIVNEQSTWNLELLYIVKHGITELLRRDRKAII